MSKFDKKALRHFIFLRKRTYVSLLNRFGYKLKMADYLKELIKDGEVSCTPEWRLFGWHQTYKGIKTKGKNK